MSHKPYVIAVGEVLWDVLPAGAVLGGAPANFSFRLSTLHVPCFLVSRVGVDERGQTALNVLQNKNVIVDFIQKDLDKPTGYVSVNLDARGNASYIIHPNVAYDTIETTDKLLSYAAEASAVCFGTLVQRCPTSRNTVQQILFAAKKAKKILDVNLRKDCYTKETIETSIELANILKLNDDEIFELKSIFSLPGETESELGKNLLQRYELDACLITRAEKGVIAITSKNESFNIPGIPVAVVDTIGAGDAFTAGFVAALLKNKPIEECCKLGNLLGAEVAQSKGGMSEVPLTGRLSDLQLV